MCSDQDFDIEGNYKRYYGFIFSYFYLAQGFVQVISGILPYLLMIMFNNQYDYAQVTFIGAMAHLPWSLKFFVGIINDKWGSDKWGRRFPFIISFGVFGGIVFIIMTFVMPSDQSIYPFLMIFLLLGNIGMAVADTSLDGMILDVTPKKKLSKVQGYTWTMLMLGNAVAVAVGLLLYWVRMVELYFLIIGIMMLSGCVLPYFIKEPPITGEVNMIKELKILVVKKKNWKVFMWTFVTAMAYPMIISSFLYFSLIHMDVIDITETTLTLESSRLLDEFIILNIIIQGLAGIGIVLGSLLIGKVSSKSRKSGLNLTYIIYLPALLLSNLFIGWFLGLSGQIIFGFSYGAITVAGMTIRGDIAKNNFPDIKSTYYSILISFSNFGQSLGNLILAFLYANVAPVLASFFILYFIITLICTGIIATSYLIFRTIDPKDYEFMTEQTQEYKIRST